MKKQKKPLTRPLVGSLLILSIFTGCASTPKNPDDPWEGWNRGTQEFNDDFDNMIMKPLAKGYLFSTPEAVDKGVTNFFSNIDDIGVTVNSLLQFKLLQAGMNLSRFVVNTTVGVVGVMDIASDLDLPKHNEDFGQTLATWGVPSGPYLVLPFWGPSTPRGTAGLMGDAFMDPLNYTLFASFAVSAASTMADVVDATDRRAGYMTSEKIVKEAAIDRYSFIKGSYLQYRDFLVNDGEMDDEDDVLLDGDIYDENPGYRLELYQPAEQ